MRTPLEFEIDGQKFKARPLSADVQFTLLRKASPLLASGIGEFLPLYMKLKKEGLGKIEDIPLDRLVELLMPISKNLASLPEDDFRFIMRACLSQCEWFRDGVWAHIWNAQASISMFEEINDDAMLQLRIVVSVFSWSLTPFFRAGLSALPGREKV